MANMIIRPATGTGNKVIVQDQAGAAVLTTADSGATVANATLTAPTIANMANCTFPAGHVLQTVYSTQNYDYASTSTSYATLKQSSGVDWIVSITPSSASSKILVMYNLSLRAYRNSSQDARATYRLMRDIGSGYVYTGHQYRKLVGIYDYGSGGTWSASICSINHIETPNTTNQVNFRVDCRTEGAYEWRQCEDGDSSCDCVLMEVAG